MSRYSFEKTGLLISGTDTFKEATAEELKLLIAVLERDSFESMDEIAELAGISKARCASALALWQESGVIRPVEESFYGTKLVEEFSLSGASELDEPSAAEAAEQIRSKRLADLFCELAEMVGKPMLSPAEVKKLCALSSQYAVTEDYIAALAAYMNGQGELTVHKLVGRAMRLCEQGIDKVEELEIYISDKERERSEFFELRRALGIFGRKLSNSERKYFSKWLGEYGFSVEVVGEAYDITALNTGKADMRYMDKLLSDWHSEGCVSVLDCRARYERSRAEREAARTAGKTAAKPASSKKPALRFGDFDPEEALKKALSRSFPSETDKKE